MSVSQTITFTVTDASGSISQSVTNSSETCEQYEVSIDAAAADYELNCNIPNDELKGLFILCSQDLNMDYNDAGGTQGTIDLDANQPVVWYTGCPWALTSVMGYAGAALDITKFFIDNDGGTTATLYIRVLRDASP